MFLTIGEKIRKARKQYGLKQVSFEPFGFSRNYISMLETNKRFLNEEMLQIMYGALEQLTDGNVKEEYTYQQFCLNPKEQAEIWLEGHCTLEYGLSDYEAFYEIAITYDLLDQLINLDEIVGMHYMLSCDHQTANDYFLRAIANCAITLINPAKYYNLVGVNFGQMGQYKDAIAQYKIALNFITDSDLHLKYKNMYDLAVAYLYDAEYDQSISYVDVLMNQNENLKVKASSYVLKGLILKKLKRYEDAKKVFEEFINNPFYYPVLGFVYHNLAYLEYEWGYYENSLAALKLSIEHRGNHSDNNVTWALIGEIYYRLNDYEQAKSIFNEIKNDVFTVAHMDQKEDFLTWGLQMYLDLKEFDYIVSLFQEVKEFIKQGLVSQPTYLLMEKQLYKNIIKETLNSPDEILKYTSLLKSID